MSDLISRKALLEDMKHFCRRNCRNCDWSTFLANDEHCGLIDRQPTAYDTDKILEQLAMNSHRVETHEYGSERVVGLIDATYIVKGIYEEISRGEFDKAIEIVRGASNK